jgi:hypothetical protein
MIKKYHAQYLNDFKNYTFKKVVMIKRIVLQINN